MKLSSESILRPFKVGVRSKLMLCFLTILLPYIFYFSNLPYLQIPSIVIFLVAAELMIFFWGSFFANNFIETIFKKKSIIWVDFPEYSKLALEMKVKLNKKKPFGIMKNLDNAYANPLTRQIIFGEKLIERLTDKERLALFGHELTHIAENHNVKLVWWTMIPVYLTIIPLVFKNPPQVMIYVIAFAAFVLAFVFTSWRNERAADTGAVQIAGKEAVLSLLRNITPRRNWGKETETHPAIISRIRHIRKKFFQR